MRLAEFRIQNFRSIYDSGWVRVDQRTALVGRNESGKSNLLMALASFNSSNGQKPLSRVKDFPRDRRRSEFSEDLIVVDTRWELTDQEQTQLSDLFPRAKGTGSVTIHRTYKTGLFYIHFDNLPELSVDRELVTTTIDRLRQSIGSSARNRSAEDRTIIHEAVDVFDRTLSAAWVDSSDWIHDAGLAIEVFQQSLAGAAYTLTPNAEVLIDTIQTHANHIQSDSSDWISARQWVMKKIPIFIYLSDYPELSGHQSITDYLARTAASESTEYDNNFAKLAKVANLDPEELQLLLDEEPEERQVLANRAGALVTQTVRRFWTDRELTVRFNLDGEHFDTLISEPNTEYSAEVNFDERSRGFKWFFSFYITFAADTSEGPAEDAILLLDEPGLHLHATAQKDLLAHFKDQFHNQIIYTTHSPFMVPIGNLTTIRTVNIEIGKGTTVASDLSGDSRTLFPLQAALGYDLTQTLFIGPNNLVVEGVTDFWYISAISEFFRDSGIPTLPVDLTITPAGGAQKVSYMVALLTSENLKVLVLLDDESYSRNTAEELVKTKLMREENVVFVSEAFTSSVLSGADIEDLVDPIVYDRLVLETYVNTLGGTALPLNANIPRIVLRYEDAFKQMGYAFHKTGPAKRFLRLMATDPNSVLPQASRDKFEALFAVITARHSAQIQRSNAPFV